MKALGWVIMGLIAIVVLLMAGVLAGRVGGIAIRKQGAAEQPLITVSQPVVPGVPTVVRWPVDAADDMPGNFIFYWRDAQREYQLGEASFGQGQATLHFPCEAAATEGGLIVRAATDGKVVSNQPVTLAAPGPDCVR